MACFCLEECKSKNSCDLSSKVYGTGSVSLVLFAPLLLTVLQMTIRHVSWFKAPPKDACQIHVIGDGVQGAIWSLVEPATAIISACLPTYRPLFTRHAQESEDRYISKHQTVTVTSAQVPPACMQLSAPSPTYKVWTGTRAPSHDSDLDEELLGKS